MKVLVVNSGSSSLKYQVIETDGEKALAKGGIERIGESFSLFSGEGSSGGSVRDEHFACPTHKDAVEKVLSVLTDPKLGAFENLCEIEAIGHRVVHGGEVFCKSTLASEDTLKKLEELSDLAPLHNPANIMGIRECMRALPGVANVMVFDTAFHNTMPDYAYLYGLPLTDYKDFKIRKYGFHGTSHSFVAKECAKMVGKSIKDLNILVCHIGNGASLCAVKGGASLTTTMGMTPTDGLIMGTRSGSVDPAIVEVLARGHNMSVSEVTNYLNKKCGLLGLSGISNDMRDITCARDEGNDSARIAFDCFVFRLVKLMGECIAAMSGVDCIIFTGGIGTNNAEVRERAIKHFEFLGAKIDKEKNNKLNGGGVYRNTSMDITKQDSKVSTLVICTNEELEIARDTALVVSDLKK